MSQQEHPPSQQPALPELGCAAPGSGLAADSFAHRLRTVVYDARSALPSLLDALTELRQQLEEAPAVGVLFVRVNYPREAVEHFSWDQIVGIYDGLALTARSLVGVTLRNVDLPADLGLAQEGFAVLLSRPREKGVLHKPDTRKVAKRYAKAIQATFRDMLSPRLAQRISVQVGSGLICRPQPSQSLEDVLVAGLVEAHGEASRLHDRYLSDLARSIEDTLVTGGLAVNYQVIVDCNSGLPVGFSTHLAPSPQSLPTEEALIDAARSSEAAAAVYRAFHARAIEGAKADLREDEWLVLPVCVNDLMGNAVLDVAALYDEAQVRGIGPSNLVFMADGVELFAGFPTSPAAFRAAADIGFRLGLSVLVDSLPPLDHLRALGLSLLQLGGRLVEALPSDPDAFELAALLARFCRRHGIRLLGTDCQTAMQFEALRRVGVDLVQGAYVGPRTPSPTRRSFRIG